MSEKIFPATFAWIYGAPTIAGTEWRADITGIQLMNEIYQEKECLELGEEAIMYTVRNITL